MGSGGGTSGAVDPVTGDPLPASGGGSVMAGSGASGTNVVSGAGGGSSGAGGSVAPFDAGGVPMGPPADLDMNFYKCNVEPIFDRGCAMMGCHGTESGRPLRLYARGRLRNTAEMVDNQSCLQKTAPFASGTIMCTGWHPHSATEWQRNFDSARQFMTKGMQPDQSQLLTQATKGGLPHAGVHLFAKDDASYTMIKRWLSGEKLAACDPNPN
jgi:hypothetical protein